MNGILGYGLLTTALLYAALAGYFWITRWRAASGVPFGASDAVKNRAPLGFSGIERVGISAVVALHATLLLADVGGWWSAPRFGFAHALSAMTLCALVVYGIESLIHPLDGMPALVLPVAAVAVVLPALFPGVATAVLGGTALLATHVAVAMAAYGLFTIGAAHAVLMALVERDLQRRRGRGAAGGTVAGGRKSALSALPPLLTLERLMFHFIWAGFALLTLTVASGVVFSEQLFGRAFRFDHKTVFALISWALFAALLTGRVVRGWRGRTALNWTLAGYAVLLLAYVGSRFVLEVILQRTGA